MDHCTVTTNNLSQSHTPFQDETGRKPDDFCLKHYGEKCEQYYNHFFDAQANKYRGVWGVNGKLRERDVQSSLILLWNKRTPAKYFLLQCQIWKKTKTAK